MKIAFECASLVETHTDASRQRDLILSIHSGQLGDMNWTTRAIATWELTQVELHGQYSTERLQQFNRYYQTTSRLRVACVVAGTAVPCLVLVLLADLIPLQNPFGSATQRSSQWLFWAHNLMVSCTLSLALLIECRALVTRLEMSVRNVAAMALFLCSGTSCAQYGLSKVIGFPVPFTLVTGGSAWYVLFAGCVYFRWGNLIRRNPTVRLEIEIYMKCWSRR